MVDVMLDNVPFNYPACFDDEVEFTVDALRSRWTGGNGPYTTRTQKWLKKRMPDMGDVLLTTSCTHALELSAILMDLQPGDEVIVPSYTFVTTALAFYMHGAQIVFCDIRSDTLNLDETKLEELITKKTRAIVCVHYAGVSCEMDVIMDIARLHNLIVIEDNAHGLFGKYKEKHLGTIGDFATQSFHETKNISCGEGGALIVNNERHIERAEVIREKGTNRSRFFRGQVDKYTWVDKGSSYVLSDILAATLYGQLTHVDEIQNSRKETWDVYWNEIKGWAEKGKVRLPFVPNYCQQTYHMFYLLMPSINARSRFIEHMKENGVSSVFHYLPLHESDMGKSIAKGGTVNCPVSSDTSDRLVRLPMFFGMNESQKSRVVDAVNRFEM